MKYGVVVVADLTKEADANKSVKDAVQMLGGLDILVNWWVPVGRYSQGLHKACLERLTAPENRLRLLSVGCGRNSEAQNSLNGGLTVQRRGSNWH